MTQAASLRVLVGCESSGKVRAAFRARGFNAWSCDLQPADDGSQHHIQGDLRHAGGGWDLAILHPPCTRLTNSGVRWLAERNLWGKLDEAAKFFQFCLGFDADSVAVENPIQHKHAKQRIGVDYAQIIHPWQFGHGETKATCLWLRNLPKLHPTNIVEGREPRIHKLSPSADRWKIRSETYQGIADAMAQQWGDYIMEKHQ